MTDPRGIRNNNPLNIRKGKSRWTGTHPEKTDPEFVCFLTPTYGIRAAVKILFHYQQWHGLWTVYQMISRWAPPEENDTTTYANQVAGAMGIPTGNRVDLKEDLSKLHDMVYAMIEHENGIQPYTRDDIDAGIAMALL